MKKILSLQEYQSLLNSNKQAHGAVDTNCFLMSSSFAPYVDAGRLYYEQYDQGVVVYIDEGDYYNLYYYLEKDAAFPKIHQEKPILIEEIDSRGTREAYLQELEPRLQTAGFSLYRVNEQFEKKLSAEDPEPAYRKMLDALQVQHLSITRCTDKAMAAEVIRLWESELELSDVPAAHRQFLEKGDTVYCIVNEKGQVVSTYWWARAGRRAYEARHIVTHPEYLRKGLGKTLMLACFMDVKAQGVDTIITWISDQNTRSIALHEKMGFRKNGRHSRQYR